MTDLSTFNARRRERAQARVNELMELVREKPKLTDRQIVSTLAKRWRVSTRTVRVTMQYCKRKKLIRMEKVWMTPAAPQTIT